MFWRKANFVFKLNQAPRELLVSTPRVTNAVVFAPNIPESIPTTRSWRGEDGWPRADRSAGTQPLSLFFPFWGRWLCQHGEGPGATRHPERGEPRSQLANKQVGLLYSVLHAVLSSVYQQLYEICLLTKQTPRISDFGTIILRRTVSTKWLIAHMIGWLIIGICTNKSDWYTEVDRENSWLNKWLT